MCSPMTWMHWRHQLSMLSIKLNTKMRSKDQKWIKKNPCSSSSKDLRELTAATHQPRVPNMFKQIQVKRMSWPFNLLQTVTLSTVHNNHSFVRIYIIINLNAIISNNTRTWVAIQMKDLIPISLTNLSFSMEHIQLSITIK